MVRILLALTVFLISCARSHSEAAGPVGTEEAKDAPLAEREIRLTGVIEAVHSSKVMTPQIYGNYYQFNLIRLIPNGARVKEGDVVAEFDPIQQLEAAFSAKAKYEDLGHQVEQKASQNRADSEKRRGDLTQAQADRAKALLELEKAEVLSEIQQEQNRVKAESAKSHVESLSKSNATHDASDAAALRILELQRDRQKVALERAEINIERLHVRAPLPGLVAYQTLYRGNSQGHAQEGDQLYRGQAILSIFDPSEMMVRCLVAEPDRAYLVTGARAVVHLDAYPDLELPAHFEYASPMASSALGSPIKTFTAVFKLDKTDSRLMPDLSAAVVIGGEK
jgi:HlyD family secretion protein